MSFEKLKPETATSLATYTGAYEGEAAITMNSFGKGKAVYIGADLDLTSLARVLRTVLAISGSSSAVEAPPGVEVTRRRAGEKEWVFVLNHTAKGQKVSVTGKFRAVVGNEPSDGTLSLSGYDLAVLRRI